MAVNLGEVLATTIRHYRDQLTENITTNEQLLWQLDQGDRVVEIDGGESIVEPLMYAENSQVESYKGADTLTVAHQDVIDASTFDWKQIAGTLVYTGREEFQNSGKERMVNLIQGKMDNLELSLRLGMNAQMFSDGTGNSGKDITGLKLAVEDGTAWSTYGNIDSNTYTFWRNQWAGSVGSFGTGLTAAGILKMRTIYYSASRGKDSPDLGFTTQTVYELYENALGSNVRIIDEKFANAGFADNLKFKGMTLFYDPDAESGSMIFLNTKYLKFAVGKGKNFVMLPPVRPSDQEVYVSSVIVYCNLITSNRRRQGRLDGIIA